MPRLGYPAGMTHAKGDTQKLARDDRAAERRRLDTLSFIAGIVFGFLVAAIVFGLRGVAWL